MGLELKETLNKFMVTSQFDFYVSSILWVSPAGIPGIVEIPHVVKQVCLRPGSNHWLTKNVKNFLHFIEHIVIPAGCFARHNFSSKPKWQGGNNTLHCTENRIYVFPEKELHGLSPNSYFHVSVIDLYIPRIGPHIWLQPYRQTHPGNI